MTMQHATRAIGVVGIVGFGTIGQRWAAAFRHAGLTVKAYDPDPGQWQQFSAIDASLASDLATLHGSEARAQGAIHFTTSLSEALSGVHFVQECGPEKLNLKQDLLAAMESCIAGDIIIASSSSALKVSDMQARCARPERIVLGHPFNPAHLMPLVEIVGGDKTDPQVVAAARAFYESIGKKPVVMNREITGHLALRLMGAMWREAIALVRDGVASAEDVDRAFIYGPGPKWGLQGAFISNALNAADIDAFLVKYGPTYQAIWNDLGVAKLDAPTIAKVAAATKSAMGDRSPDDLRAARDAGLVELLRVLSQRAAL